MVTMAGKYVMEESILNSIVESVVDAIPVLNKKLLGVVQLVREQEMPFSHMQILAMLKRQPLSIGELSRRLAIAKPNITPLVDDLCGAGYVERVRDDHDRRVVKVRLLDNGYQKLNAIAQSETERVRAWGESLSRSEARELNRSLQSLLRLLELLPDET